MELLTPRLVAVTALNEGVNQLTSSPVFPSLDPSARIPAKDGRFEKMSPMKRLIATNEEAGKSALASMDTFVRHPIRSFVPMVEQAAEASVDPFLHAGDIVPSVVECYKQRGLVDAANAAINTLANPATVLGTAVGAAAAGVGFVGTLAAAPAVVAGAMAVAGVALSAVEIGSVASLVGDTTQFVFDEAQSAAPESGIRLPRGVPLVGGLRVFSRTTHDQQVALLKFDGINVVSSAVLAGIAKMNDRISGSRGRVLAYSASGAAQTGTILAQTPTDGKASGLLSH